jgi:hypothetical protein
MIGAKEAVAVAAGYMTDIYGQLEGLLVEEIELDEAANIWKVTMGFWQALPPKNVGQPIRNHLAELMEPRRVKRTFKLLEIGAHNGEVLSMKIRQLPSADPAP